MNKNLIVIGVLSLVILTLSLAAWLDTFLLKGNLPRLVIIRTVPI
jgi:hypothetical protein